MYPGDPSSDNVAREMAASLVAISAAAFAVESEADRVTFADAQTPPKPRRRGKPNRGDWIGQALVEQGQFALDDAARLGELFNLRNESVHPTHEWDEVMPWHPAGFTRVVAEYAIYTVEASREAVAVAKLAISGMSGQRHPVGVNDPTEIGFGFAEASS